jgi:hypothetical protein
VTVGTILLFAVAGLWACRGRDQAPEPIAAARAWPEANRLFRDAPAWHGGDAAYSVDLGNERVLWLFGDSFVGPVDELGTRSGSRMVRNSVAIQRGYDPTSATMTFYHGRTQDGPGPFFGDHGDRWLWPGDGVRFASGSLLLTFALVTASNEGLGFETVGSSAFLIDNPDADPPRWSMRRVELPSHDLGVQLGAGALLQENDWLYAFAPAEPGNHDVYLARWRLQDAERGDLKSARWWGDGWGDWSSARKVARDVQTEFTVHRAHDGLLWLYDQATELEKLGGRVIELKGHDWSRVGSEAA